MDIGSILIGLALAIFTGVFIARPLVDRRGLSLTASERHLSTLQAERDRVLAAIEELEMDHAMGKIHFEDYQQQRNEWVQRGVEVLRAMDDYEGSSSAEDLEVYHHGTIEAELEAAVARLRSDRAERSHRYCGSCGAEIVMGDRFCTQCGTALAVEEIEG